MATCSRFQGMRNPLLSKPRGPPNVECCVKTDSISSDWLSRQRSSSSVEAGGVTLGPLWCCRFQILSVRSAFRAPSVRPWILVCRAFFCRTVASLSASFSVCATRAVVQAVSAAVIAALALSIASLATSVALGAWPNTVYTTLATVPSALRASADIVSPPAAKHWTV